MHQVPAGAPVFTPDTGMTTYSSPSQNTTKPISQKSLHRPLIPLPPPEHTLPFLLLQTPPFENPFTPTTHPLIHTHTNPPSDLALPFPELTPTASEKTITKQHPGAFTATDLDAFLTQSGKQKVVLTGYMAHVCVSTTARQATERGYDVILAEGAIGDRDVPGAKAEELVRVVLVELADAFGSVVGVGDIV